MRKLGAELGVEAMSLYNHVPNKGALLDGMVEVLLGELEIPLRNQDWEERIREGYRAFRRLAHEHP
ncbi:MAG: TetR/AcrR family transcriptional regulator, partial [Rubrobacteraceae bacterium]